MADNDFRVKRGIVVGTDAFISNSITHVNSISFNTTQEYEPGEGSMGWSNVDATLSVGLAPDLRLQLGLESLYTVVNQTGSTIFSNTVVMANGTVGNSGTILVSPAIGNGNFPADLIMGVTPKDIPNGETGYVTAFGKIRRINTSMFSEGDILYLDPANPGKMMNTAPIAPNVKATIAFVVTKHPNAGEIVVRPTFADRLSQLQDVAILDGITDGQGLAWVAANSRFENKTIVGDQSNTYNTYITLTSNDYNTLITAYSNDYNTLLSARANDYNSFNTLTANIYNTFAYLDSNTNPAGSDQQVQFNNNGSFGASSSLIFDGTTIKAPMLEATQSSGSEGGEIKLNKPATSTTINNGITIDVYQDKVRLFETGGTNRGGYWDITALSAGVGTNLLSGGGGGDVANAWVNANDYSTLLSAYSNDGATLLTARSNDYSTLLTAQANDFNSFTTLTANIYNTLLAAQSNDGATLLTARANDYNTLLTAYSNDYATILSAQSNDGATLLTARSNDYNTLLAAYSNDFTTLNTALANDGATLLTARSNDYNTLLAAYANDYNSYTSLSANDYNSFTTLTANIYNTFAYLNANVGGGGGDVANAWVNANDYNTYTTLTANIYNTYETLSSAPLYAQKFTVDGSTNSFTLSNSVSTEEAILVYIDGVVQHSDAYVVNGTNLTIANTLPLPTSTLGIRKLSGTTTNGSSTGGLSYLRTYALG